MLRFLSSLHEPCFGRLCISFSLLLVFVLEDDQSSMSPRKCWYKEASDELGTHLPVLYCKCKVLLTKLLSVFAQEATNSSSETRLLPLLINSQITVVNLYFFAELRRQTLISSCLESCIYNVFKIFGLQQSNTLHCMLAFGL